MDPYVRLYSLKKVVAGTSESLDIGPAEDEEWDVREVALIDVTTGAAVRRQIFVLPASISPTAPIGSSGWDVDPAPNGAPVLDETGKAVTAWSVWEPRRETLLKFGDKIRLSWGATVASDDCRMRLLCIVRSSTA